MGWVQRLLLWSRVRVLSNVGIGHAAAHAARAGVRARPYNRRSLFFFLLRAGSQRQLAIHRVGVELDVEPLSIRV